MTRRPPCAPGLSAVLDGIDLSIDRDSARRGVPLAVVLGAAGRRAYGPLLLVMGLFALSPLTAVPGVTAATALVIFAIALQMALGAKRPWLPRRMLRMNVPRGLLFKFVDKVRPGVEQAERVWLRPRFEFLCDGPCAIVIAICVAAAALVTLPLSIIPFAPTLPSLAVLMFGLSMTSRDGLLVGLAVGLTGGAFALAAPMMQIL